MNRSFQKKAFFLLFSGIFLVFIFGSWDAKAGLLPYTARLNHQSYGAELGAVGLRSEIQLSGDFLRDDADTLNPLTLRRDLIEFPDRRFEPTRVHWAMDLTLRSSFVKGAAEQWEVGYGARPALYWQTFDSFGAGCRAVFDYGEREDLQIGGGEFDFQWTPQARLLVFARAGYMGYLAKATSDEETRVYSQRDEKSFGLRYQSSDSLEWRLRASWMKYSEESVDLLLAQMETVGGAELSARLQDNLLSSFALITSEFPEYQVETEVRYQTSNQWTHLIRARFATAAPTVLQYWGSLRWESTQKREKTWSPTFGGEVQVSDQSWGVLGILRFSRWGS
jgi:hypothetical protein